MSWFHPVVAFHDCAWSLCRKCRFPLQPLCRDQERRRALAVGRLIPGGVGAVGREGAGPFEHGVGLALASFVRWIRHHEEPPPSHEKFRAAASAPRGAWFRAE